MYVGVRPTDYKFPPLGANMTPPKRSPLGACCNACAQNSHFPPPTGADSMARPVGDVVDFVTSPTGLVAVGGLLYYFLVHRKRR